MTTLNWYRDQLPSLVNGPLVVMLSPDGLRRLFTHAPDLFAWRAHTTRVTAPGPVDREIRPRPDRQASVEEKAWLERMIAAAGAELRLELAQPSVPVAEASRDRASAGTSDDDSALDALDAPAGPGDEPGEAS